MGDADTTWEFTRRRLAVPGVSVAYGYFAEGLTPGRHRGLPSRDLTFVISLDGPVETAESPGAWAEHRLERYDVVVAGLHTRPAYVHQPRRQRGIQLAVHPLAARSLFGARAAELCGASYEGEDLLGDGVRLLRDRLHELAGAFSGGRGVPAGPCGTERAVRAATPRRRCRVAAAH